jgi:hypothetical protein
MNEPIGRLNMDSETKSHWVAALRSGDYKQGTKVLRTVADSYCCLGVLCNLVDPNGWERSGVEIVNHDSYAFRYKGKRVYGALPVDLQGEKHISPWVNIHLIHMNDSGSTFDQIADWIEENL